MLSCNFISKTKRLDGEKQQVPKMLHEHSECEDQALVRDKLAGELVNWLKLNPPNEVFS